MVVYLLCFDLSKSTEEQITEVLYWLEYLNSSLPLLGGVPKFTILVVGLKSDLQTTNCLQPEHIQAWQIQRPRLVISPKMLPVSSIASLDSVKRLLTVIEGECTQILNKYAALIPKAYRILLNSIQQKCRLQSRDSESIVPTDQLFQQFANGMNKQEFSVALQYLHSIGHIVVLKSNGLVCIDLTLVPQIASKFISPDKIRMQLLKKGAGVIQILDKNEVGALLNIDPRNERYIMA